MKTNKEIFTIVPTWEIAKKNSIGYQSPKLVENLALNLKQNPPWNFINKLPLSSRIMELFAAIFIGLKDTTKMSISVADVGGGNGYMGIHVMKIFPNINWNWVVYESNEIAEAYSKVISKNDPISYNSLDNLKLSISQFDIVLVSCTLQYLEDPFSLLNFLLSISIPKIIMRIPFVDSENDLITVQDFSKIGGYAGIDPMSWPSWWFSKQKFYSTILKNNKILLSWVTDSESYFFQGRDIPLEGIVCI